jgi:hypothetical protein
MNGLISMSDHPFVISAELLASQIETLKGPDRSMDCFVWMLLDPVFSDDDQRWRQQLPLAPRSYVNGMTMWVAVQRFPGDMSGIARNWCVPKLTGDLGVIRGFIPDACSWSLDSVRGQGSEAMITIGPDTRVGRAITPELAFCAAFVRCFATDP